MNDSTSRGSLTPGIIIRSGLWFALAAGILEALIILSRHRVIMQAIQLNPQVAWMAPVGSVLWFSFPVGLLLLVAWLRGGKVPAHLAIGILATVGWLTPALLLTLLHPVAIVVLALGLGVQTTRLLVPRLAGFERLMRRTLPAMVLAVALTAMAMTVWPGLRERRELARLGPVAGRKPNVVLIVWDTVRRASLSLYGYPRPTTPSLERWSERGIVFDHAFATTAWTLPSHASMFTGRLMHDLSVGWTAPYDGRWTTLAEWLETQGYRTGGFAANSRYLSSDTGVDRGFQHYRAYSLSVGELILNSSIGRTLFQIHLVRRLLGFYDMLGRESAPEMNAAVLGWIPRDSTRPFFAFLNYLDAHQPYLPPDRFDQDFATSEIPRDFSQLDLRPHMGRNQRKFSPLGIPDRELKREQDAYDASIAYLDNQLDSLLLALQERGQLENTIVIITADHGEQFMEHGLLEHGNSLYRFVTEVPLVMIMPSSGALPRRIAAPVSLAGIPATIAALVAPGQSHPFPGGSLAGDSLDGAPVVSELVLPANRDTMTSITTGEYRAIWSRHARPQLYRFPSDSAELNDLAEDSTFRPVLAGLRRQLEAASPWLAPESAHP